METLFLTKDEREAFLALPESLTKGWVIETEREDGFETAQQLTIRANMLDLRSFPALKAMASDLKAGKQVDPSVIKEVPEEALPELLFTIGAVGISNLMAALYKVTKTTEDVRALASFSELRHDIITANLKAVAA